MLIYLRSFRNSVRNKRVDRCDRKRFVVKEVLKMIRLFGLVSVYVLMVL